VRLRLGIGRRGVIVVVCVATGAGVAASLHTAVSASEVQSKNTGNSGETCVAFSADWVRNDKLPYVLGTHRLNSPKDTTLASLPEGSSVPPRASDLATPVALPERVPAQSLDSGCPPMAPAAVILMKNGWMVGDERSTMFVYAGRSGNRGMAGMSTTGRFVILRIRATGAQTTCTVDVPNAGALSITEAPEGAAVETSAQTGTIIFTSTSGISGALDLGTDKVSLN